LVDKESLQRTVNVIFSEGEPESINLDLADLITEPACIVPFMYSMNPKRVAEFIPKVMSLPGTDSVFDIDIERLFEASTEKRELVYQVLTLPDCEQMQQQLKRQITLTDHMTLNDSCELLMEVLEQIIKKKVFCCKVLIRSILVLYKKDADNFERTH